GAQAKLRLGPGGHIGHRRERHAQDVRDLLRRPSEADELADLTLSHRQPAGIRMGRIVLDGDDEAPAIGIEAVYQRPASVYQACPTLHGAIGIAAPLRSARL